jgi:hypothetical protein
MRRREFITLVDLAIRGACFEHLCVTRAQVKGEQP